MTDLSFYKNKKVLLTGHTGFKGTWMSTVLVNAGADLTGYSRCSEKTPDFFELSGVSGQMNSVKGDIRDLKQLQRVFDEVRPEVVIHMAAQPIVRESYANPVDTYETNVMGTVNVLECVRCCDSVKSFLNVTTDKVYLNDERNEAFREDEPLDGYDPYSNSKSCSELVTHAYCNSFFKDRDTAISTARAGNVIGGGDFSKDRIIPDCVRSAVKNEAIVVRNPASTRPYQHVLEPVTAYLMIAANPGKAGWYNVGPDDCDCFETARLVDAFVKCWGGKLHWTSQPDGGPHEANFLKLDNTKLKESFGWQPKWNLDTAIVKAVEWYKLWNENGDVRTLMDAQIKEYLK